MSSEEFFMYLTIALIVVIPVSARIYRYVTAKQLERTMRQEFGKPPETGRAGDAGKRSDHGI